MDQASQPSVLGRAAESHVPEQSHDAERPYEPEVHIHNQDIQDNPPQAPWVNVMSDVKLIQQSSGQLKTQLEIRIQRGHESYCCGPRHSLEKTSYD